MFKEAIIMCYNTLWEDKNVAAAVFLKNSKSQSGFERNNDF